MQPCRQTAWQIWSTLRVRAASDDGSNPWQESTSYRTSGTPRLVRGSGVCVRHLAHLNRRFSARRILTVTAFMEENSLCNQLLTTQYHQNLPNHVQHLGRNEIVTTDPARPGQQSAHPQPGHPGRQDKAGPNLAIPFAERIVLAIDHRICAACRLSQLRANSPFRCSAQVSKHKNNKSENAERSKPDIGQIRSAQAHMSKAPCHN
jgi:hypothetical protein